MLRLTAHMFCLAWGASRSKSREDQRVFGDHAEGLVGFDENFDDAARDAEAASAG